MFRFNPAAAAAVSALITIAAGSAAQAQQAGGDFALHDGDRVVFYGDSITDQRLYTVFAEDYVLTRFPKRNITFVHSGWGGDRVTGGGGGPIDLRLERDVFPYKPTMVTIMLGMNDGGYRAFDAELFSTYTKGYIHIIDSIQKAVPGVRFTLIDPSPYDDVTRAPGFIDGYNSVLMRYGAFVRDTAQRDSFIFSDFNSPMVAMLRKANAADSADAQKLLPDRVHPSPAGHLIMAEALVKAWNAPALVASVEIDAANKKITKAENAKVGGLKTGNVLSWDETDDALPMIVDPTDPLVSLALKSSDFTDALNQEPLKVSGLDSAKRYTLLIDGSEVGDFGGDQLGQGINLATLPTPMADQALNVLALTREHDDQHFYRWRTIQVPLSGHSKEVQKALPQFLHALDTEEEETVSRQRAAAQPVAHHYEIVAALPAPTGPNLAKGKPYVTSDPNTYGFGAGALTDGSFEGNGQHTFATGDTNTFPKTATIDLGTPASIGSVLVGMPAFGSTKTVVVSVSADGSNFTEVGRHVFALRREAKHVYRFPAVNARYVRLTYPDHYDDYVGYSQNFSFTSEVEVYAAEPAPATP